MFTLDRKKLLQIAEEDGMLIYDGFDEAITGLASRCGENTVVAYNIDKIIEILMRRDKMSFEEALEYYSFNMEGAYMGDCTPVNIRLIND